MEYVVLDTDVSSRILRDRLTDPLAARLTGRLWCVTFVTVGELWQWADMRSWGVRSRRELESWLASVVVLSASTAVARTWGRISAAAHRRGRPRPSNDTWVAATCLARDVPLATLNVKDFSDFAEHEGLVLLR
jgi:predicted nucleic acid-binding protein